MHACTVRARHPPRQGHVSQRKLFFGGLGPETTDASLLKAAVRYGKVQEAVVVRTDGGKSRGFGFVTCARVPHRTRAKAKAKAKAGARARARTRAQAQAGPRPRPGCGAGVGA